MGKPNSPENDAPTNVDARYSTFLPTIIRGLGTWTTAEVQCLTIPCYALGAITYLIVAWFSDRYQRRGIMTVIFGIISCIGYAVLISNAGNGPKYFGCFLVAMGLYVVVGIPLGLSAFISICYHLI